MSRSKSLIASGAAAEQPDHIAAQGKDETVAQKADRRLLTSEGADIHSCARLEEALKILSATVIEQPGHGRQQRSMLATGSNGLIRRHVASCAIRRG